MVCVSGVGVGIDAVWEQDSVEALELKGFLLNEGI
jgi:hypothetical protein